MVFTLPSYNDEINKKADRKKKIFQNNIQYNPIYNNIYDLDPKEVDISGESQREQEVNIFNMSLITILKNIANTLLLILIDLTNIENYSNLNNFLKIFIIENRLMYFGLFVILVSLYIILFFQ